MVSYGCPNCHGALFVESFREEGKKYVEIACINCARLWTPEQLAELAKAHVECCTRDNVIRRVRKLRQMIAQEHPSRIEVPAPEAVAV